MNEALLETETTLEGNERLLTFGGEAWVDDILFAEYGIDFEKHTIHGITPEQMIALVCKMADHLMLNGHRFEIRQTQEQDQTERLICTDESHKKGVKE